MSKLMSSIIVCLLLPVTLFSQTNSNKTDTYIQPYGGIGMMGSAKTTQTGVAHKRGDYNAFGTNFDLHVKVEGKTDVSSFYNTGIIIGHRFTKKGRIFNPGFEIDLSRTSGKQISTLVNEETQEVHNMNGPKGKEVLALVEEEFGAGHHRFYNEMNLTALNVATNFTLSANVNSKIMAYGSIGLGLSSVNLSDAKSLQTSPADPKAGYETTKDNGGGSVNHFNGSTSASANLTFFQTRFGAKAKLTDNIFFLVDVCGYYQGKADFTFGSTRYSDHAPTNHWEYSMTNGKGISLNAGFNFNL